MLKKVFFCCLFCFVHLQALALYLYVSPKGNDADPGTKEKPFATLQRALREAREIRRLGKQLHPNESILITIAGGFYQLSEPIFIRPEDSGNFASPTLIFAAEGEYPMLSGGINVNGW